MFGSLSLLAALAPAVQFTPQDELAGLIEQTDGLPHFHVAYEVSWGPTTSLLTIDYLAPHSLVVEREFPDFTWVYGMNADTFWWQSDEVESPLEARVDLLDRGGPDEALVAALRATTWRPAGAPRVYFELEWDVPLEERSSGWRDVVRTTDFGRPAHPLLGWLGSFRDQEGRLSIAGDDLAHHGPISSAFVDRETGFLRRLHLTLPRKEPVHFERIELDLETPPDARLFEPPELDPAARDTSEGWREFLIDHYEIRRNTYGRVHGLLARGERTLDDGLGEELRRVWRAMYERRILDRWQAHLDELPARLDELADRLHERREAGEPTDDLTAEIDAYYTRLADLLDEERAALVAPDPEDGIEPLDTPHWRALNELEDAAVLESFDSLVAKPVLAQFERVLDAAVKD